MIGECSGKIRSTPTEKLTFRTVKVSCAPPPERAITLPWKTWTRSRLPSTTRTWTFTSSPGANDGMSSRRCCWSTRSVDFMARPSEQQADGERSRIGDGGELFQQPAVGLGQPATGFDQVGSVAQRAVQRLGVPPAFDLAVISGPEHVG